MQKIQIHIFIFKSFFYFISGTLIGLIILQFYEPSTNEDVWFWFFSTIAQVYAALFSLIIIAYFSHRSNLFLAIQPIINDPIINLKETTLNLTETIKNISEKPQDQLTENDIKDKQDAQKAYLEDLEAFNTVTTPFSKEIESLKHEMKNYIIIIGFILLISVILLPLGHLNTNNEQILNILLKYNLTNNKLDFLLITSFLCFCIPNTYIFLNELLIKRETNLIKQPLLHKPNNKKYTKK